MKNSKLFIKTAIQIIIIFSMQASHAILSPAEMLDQELDKNAKAEMEKVLNVIQTDTVLSSKLKTLKSDLQSISSSGKPLKDRIAMHEDAVRKYNKEISQAYQLAKFNSELYFKTQQELVSKYNTKSKKKFKLLKKGDFSYDLIDEVDFEAPTEAAEIVLSKPFPLQEIAKEGDGRIDVSQESGTFSVKADGDMFKNFSNRGGLSHFFTVPSGSRRIRVSARVPDISSFTIGSAIFGAGMAQTTEKIVIEGESGVLCTASKIIQTTHVYFVDFVIQDVDSNMVLGCEFNAPPAGQDVLIKFLAKAKVDTNLATAFASINSSPDVIRVRLNPIQ